MFAKALYRLFLAIILPLLASCVLSKQYSHQNVIAPEATTPTAYTASLDVKHEIDWKCRNEWNPGEGNGRPIDKCSAPGTDKDNNFIGLALSGGGSRAAVFSAAVMFELRRYGILQQVDAISSTSGGSITSALYALSSDMEKDPYPREIDGMKYRIRWDESVVYPLLQKDLQGSWLVNWLVSANIVNYWTTYFDRTDIMAQIYTGELFGTSRDTENGLLFRDLNPQRPYLIINATNNTDIIYNPGLSIVDNCERELRWFSFTQEHFRKIHSDLDAYPISYAVAASAAFPGAFNHVTLRDFRGKESDEKQEDHKFVHLLDAGVEDNQATGALRSIIQKKDEGNNGSNRARKLIIMVDAWIPPKPEAHSTPDSRDSVVDYFVDRSLKHTHVIMMDVLRIERMEGLKHYLQDNNGKLVHVRFDDKDFFYQSIQYEEANKRLLVDAANKTEAEKMIAAITGKVADDLKLEGDRKVRQEQAVKFLDAYGTAKKTETALRIKNENADALKKVACFLVQMKMKDLRKDDYWRSIIKGQEQPGLCDK